MEEAKLTNRICCRNKVIDEESTDEGSRENDVEKGTEEGEDNETTSPSEIHNEIRTAVTLETAKSSSAASALTTGAAQGTLDIQEKVQKMQVNQAVRIVFQHIMFVEQKLRRDDHKQLFAKWIMDHCGISRDEEGLRSEWWEIWGGVARGAFRKKRNNVQAEIKKKMIGESKIGRKFAI